MNFYFLLLRAYGLNLDLDASVWTNKLNRFGPMVFNEKENVMRPSPLERTSWKKINEDIFMYTLSPAVRLGGIFIIYIRINSVSAVLLKLHGYWPTFQVVWWKSLQILLAFQHQKTVVFYRDRASSEMAKNTKLSKKIEFEFSMLGKTGIVFVTSTHKWMSWHGNALQEFLSKGSFCSPNVIIFDDLLLLFLFLSSKKVTGRSSFFFFFSPCKIAALLNPGLCAYVYIKLHQLNVGHHSLSHLNILILEVKITPAFSTALDPC